LTSVREEIYKGKRGHKIPTAEKRYQRAWNREKGAQTTTSVECSDKIPDSKISIMQSRKHG